MKLVTYRSGNGVTGVGVLKGDKVIPAANLLAQADADPVYAASMLSFFQLPAQVRADVAAASDAPSNGSGALPLDTVQLLAPVPRPSKVLGLGYNYHALCENENVTPAAEPELFAKMPTSVTGPFDPVVVPRPIDKVDFEAELGVIIGRVCQNVGAEQALEYVAGYCVVNDVTAKIIPRPPEAGSVMVSLKGPDTFAPAGPCLVTADEITDPQNLTILCRVNGEEKQDFSSSDMVHTVAEAVAYISQRITLEPGDLLSTGTSLGIGIVQKPPVFLNDGDTVECEIEGIGTIRNTFKLLAHA